MIEINNITDCIISKLYVYFIENYQLNNKVTWFDIFLDIDIEFPYNTEDYILIGDLRIRGDLNNHKIGLLNDFNLRIGLYNKNVKIEIDSDSIEKQLQTKIIKYLDSL